MNGDRLARLAVLFGSLSLVSFGGGNTVVPAMHHEAVTSQHWLTDRQFADLFALAQAAPLWDRRQRQARWPRPPRPTKGSTWCDSSEWL